MKWEGEIDWIGGKTIEIERTVEDWERQRDREQMPLEKEIERGKTFGMFIQLQQEYFIFYEHYHQHLCPSLNTRLVWVFLTLEQMKMSRRKCFVWISTLFQMGFDDCENLYNAHY